MPCGLEGLGGVADLPLAGQEHQDVTLALAAELAVTASTTASVSSSHDRLVVLVEVVVVLAGQIPISGR